MKPILVELSVLGFCYPTSVVRVMMDWIPILPWVLILCSNNNNNNNNNSRILGKSATLVVLPT
jgi:hypothetical protein